jgi:tetratricopeptide (TPR) repeat protein
MKKLKNSIILTAILLIVSFNIYAENDYKIIQLDSVKVDPQEVITQYSLFSEYHKNRDFSSALPYGWKVISMDPVKFNKWIFYKMEDCLWYLRDSSDATPELKKKLADTTVYLYDLAMKHFSDNKSYFQLRKAFITEVWIDASVDEKIKQYEYAFELDPNTDSYYYNRLGQIFKANMENDENYKSKALDLYTYLSEKEPDNSGWNTELESLVDNIDQLIDLAKKNWDLDPENLQKAWKYVSLAIKAGEMEKAIPGLEILVVKAPTNVTYWNQLSSLYYKSENTDKAIYAYRELIKLEPNTKEHYLNLGIALKDKNQLSQARVQFQKANEIAGGWGLAIFYEGLLYETAARGCGFEFIDKCVYLLAADTYRRAVSVDGSLNQARERVSALNNSIPTKEDYFFRKLKSGQSVKLEGKCYDWIGRSITVP